MPMAKLMRIRMVDRRWGLPFVFLLMLLVSWRRWTSLIADSGREMDLPRRLLEGEWLYRDVHYLYPPLSPYLNALLYRFCGLHLDVLHVSGAICSGMIVILCYCIARRLLSRNAAVAAVLAIIVWCIFKPSGNLIAPYAFAALYGMIWALAALLCTLRYAERRRKRELVVIGILIGLAAITKQEFALAAGVTLVAALVYMHWPNIKQLVSTLVLAGMPATAIALPVYAWLLYHLGWQTLIEDCHLFYTHLPASLVFYNAQRMGLDHPLSSLLQMLGAAMVNVLVASVMIRLSFINVAPANKTNKRARWMLRWSSVALVLASVCAAIIYVMTRGRWDGSPLRALPLLLLSLIVIEWQSRKKSDSEAARAGSSIFIIAVYSLMVLARVALRVPSGGAFGSFFSPTSLILIYYLLMESLPRTLGNWLQEPSIMRRAQIIGQSLFSAALLITIIVFAVRYRVNFNFEITAPRGHLFTTQPVGQAVSEAFDFIAAKTAPGEMLAVLPEGSDLTFLSGRRMPLRHQILIPGLMSERDEQQAIARLQELRVRHVLIVNRPMREFGAEAFGRDYYPALGEWIDQHYRLVKVCGPSPDAQLQIGAPTFFIKILMRAD